MNLKIKVGDRVTWSEEMKADWDRFRHLEDDTFIVLHIEAREDSIVLHLDKPYTMRPEQYLFHILECSNGMPVHFGVNLFQILHPKNSTNSCPLCGSAAEILFVSAECTNPECENHNG